MGRAPSSRPQRAPRPRLQRVSPTCTRDSARAGRGGGCAAADDSAVESDGKLVHSRSFGGRIAARIGGAARADACRGGTGAGTVVAAWRRAGRRWRARPVAAPVAPPASAGSAGLDRADRTHRTQPFGTQRADVKDIRKPGHFAAMTEPGPGFPRGATIHERALPRSREPAAQAETTGRPALRRIRRRPGRGTDDPRGMGEGRQRRRDRHRRRFDTPGDRRRRTRDSGRPCATGAGCSRPLARRRVAPAQGSPLSRSAPLR